MILIAESEFIVDVRCRHDDATLLGGSEHFEIPFAQLISLRRLLNLRVTVENVIVPLERRARPDETRGETALLRVVQVRNQDVVIDIRAERTVFAGGHGDVIWTEILDGY